MMMARTARHSSGARGRAFSIELALLTVVAICVLSRGTGLAAQELRAPAGQLDSHNELSRVGAVGHDVPSSEARTHYLTLNVSISDATIQPSSIFIPAGQPVQLLLRNRGTSEHHYRVVGLVPDDLAWVIEDGVERAGATSNEGHDHHDRTFVRVRATSPAGITPTGNEVHAYVSRARGIDVVLFTATRPGTYVVQCDLHPEKTGRLTVFDSAAHRAAAVSARTRQALTAALSRDLGSVDYLGASGVRVEATYAPAEYVTQVLGGPAAVSALEPHRYVGVLLTERVHTANLPGLSTTPDLYVSGNLVPLVDRKVITDSPHHRATFFRFARDDAFGNGHQVMTLRLASGQEATWHLPVVVPDVGNDARMPLGLDEQWGLILALLGGMLAAMWPCLFQLTVYFIPALAGIAMQDAAAPAPGRRRQVLVAAFFFILGFTAIYTATGALIGFAAQRLGDTAQFDAWQRYLGIGAGIIVIGLALRVAAKVRAPLVCRMPVLSYMAHSKRPASRLEMMLAGLAFATGCMTCFGSALVVGMVVYIGLAQSAFYGALVLFLFSLGMGVPLVLAAVAMARALPFLLKLERAVPWMGLFSAVLMAGFGVLLISGHYMLVSEWTFRLVSGSASLPSLEGRFVVSAVAVALGFAGWLVWMVASGRMRRSVA